MGMAMKAVSVVSDLSNLRYDPTPERSSIGFTFAVLRPKGSMVGGEDWIKALSHAVCEASSQSEDGGSI